jgi:GxxExxY protein
VYKDVSLKKTYRADFVCFDQIIIEVKVLPKLSGIEMAQIINYMRITKLRVGLLINFGSRKTLEWKRYVL